MTQAISFSGVSKVYGDPSSGRRALDDATFAVGAGETVSIVGRSGSGKSTLLHLAAGVDVPTSGTVSVAGRPLSSMSDAARTILRRDSIGLVFQFFHLLPQLTVRENVALPLMIAGHRGTDWQRVDELLDMVGLVDRATDPANDLSGGEMQRVALCRALVRKPAILLADEPTGNLDEGNADAVMTSLLELAREQGSTVLFVTHDPGFAAMADRRWEIHDGRLDLG